MENKELIGKDNLYQTLISQMPESYISNFQQNSKVNQDMKVTFCRKLKNKELNRKELNKLNKVC